VELPRQLRLRQRVTKGPGSRAAGVAMAFKLIESAQTRWRAVNAPHLVALVRAGAVFKNGKLIERRAVSGIRVSAAADKGHDRHLTRPA
jgi:post-segregation antitoxin (ccd killing protein)